MFEAPQVILEIKDVKAVYDIAEDSSPVPASENLERDFYIRSATEEGVRRYEKEFGIITKAADLEDRKNALLLRANDFIPYTQRTIERALKSICGDNESSVSIDSVNMIITCELEYGAKDTINQIVEYLDNIAPIAMTIKIVLMRELRQSMKAGAAQYMTQHPAAIIDGYSEKLQAEEKTRAAVDRYATIHPPAIVDGYNEHESVEGTTLSGAGEYQPSQHAIVI